MAQYITPEISHESDATLAVHDAGPSIIHQLVSQAAQLESESIFNTPLTHISKIEAQYIHDNRHRFYVFDSHHCLLDGNCTHIQLNVSIYRHLTASEYTYHMCFTDTCRHLERGHVCRLSNGCPHSRSYSTLDVHVYKSLFACTRTGRLHVCGSGFCMMGYTDLARGGMHVCPLTGIIIGSILVYETSPDSTPLSRSDTLAALEYGDEMMMLEPDEEGEDESGLSLVYEKTKRRVSTVKQITGSAKPSPNKPENREYRLRRAEEELQKHVFGPPVNTSFESTMRPVRNIEEASYSRAWPGTLEMMCQVHAACPTLVHPSWGESVPRPAWVPAMPKSGETGRNAKALAMVCVEIFERVETAVDFSFDAALGAIMHMMRIGVVLAQGATVIPQYPEMRWYAKRKLVPAVFSMQKTMTEALKHAYMQEQLGK